MKNKRGILIFNQDELDLSLISVLLEAEDCTVYITSFPLEAIHILSTNDIDVILASSKLKGMEADEFKKLVKSIKPHTSIFLLPLHQIQGKSADSSQLTLNVKEFVQFIQNHIKSESHLLNHALNFKSFFFSFTDRLLQLFEVNNKFFFNNDHLVADISRKIAIHMHLEGNLVDAIHLGALLRDVGKISIQQKILNETTPLGNEDFVSIKNHPFNSVQLLKHINFPWNIESIILHHHEHYDGKGYPDRLKGRDIPIGSRIIAVADSYVAMTSQRPYRKKLSNLEAVNEIMRMAGTQFDPEIAEIFFEVLQQERSNTIGKRLLLVLDRDETTATFLQLNLPSDTYAVYGVESAKDALDYLEDVTPYVIIADEETLSADTIDFCAEFQRKPATAAIPLLLLNQDASHSPRHTAPIVAVNPKPLDLTLLLTTIESLQGESTPKSTLPDSESSRIGVSGNLEDMELPDIIQLLNMGLKTARIILKNDQEKGEIFMKRGKIIRVRTGDLGGAQAFYRMMSWKQGIFRILHGPIDEDEINITVDTMTLLMEACQVLDESRFKKGSTTVPPQS